MDWRYRAECLSEDPELFFPVGISGPAQLQVDEAKAVCRRCPVRAECLRWALDSNQDAGVWGGASEGERRAMKRRGRIRTDSVTRSPCDGRDDTVIDLLVNGAKIPAASAIDLAHAAVRLMARRRGSREDIAQQLGTSAENVRRWCGRAARGEGLVGTPSGQR